MAVKLVKGEGAVIKRRRKTEAVVDQSFLTGSVSGVHTSDLRQRNVRFIDHQQEIIGHEVQQSERNGSGRTSGEDAGIILYSRAEANLLQHFDIILGSLLDALGFNEHIPVLEILDALVELCFNLLNGIVHLFLADNIMARRENRGVTQCSDKLAGDHVHLADPVDLIAEELHTDNRIGGACGIDLHNVTADSELISDEVDVVSLIVYADQLCQQLVAGFFHSLSDGNHHRLVFGGVAEGINAGDRGYNNNIAALGYSCRRRMTQLVYFVVDGGIFLYINILAGDICLGLVVIIV